MPFCYGRQAPHRVISVITVHHCICGHVHGAKQGTRLISSELNNNVGEAARYASPVSWCLFIFSCSFVSATLTLNSLVVPKLISIFLSRCSNKCFASS